MPMTLSEEHAAGFLDFLSEAQVILGRKLTLEELKFARLAYGDGFVRASEVANRTIRAMVHPAARDDGAHAGPAADGEGGR